MREPEAAAGVREGEGAGTGTRRAAGAGLAGLILARRCSYKCTAAPLRRRALRSAQARLAAAAAVTTVST